MPNAPLPQLSKATAPNSLRTTLSVAILSALLGGSCIAMFAVRGTKSYAAAKSNADDYLSQIEAHDFAGARGEMTDEGEATASVEAIADLVANEEKRRGKMLRHEGPLAWREDERSGMVFVQLSYKEIFEHGSTTIRLVMLVMKEQDDYFRAQSLQFAL